MKGNIWSQVNDSFSLQIVSSYSSSKPTDRDITYNKYLEILCGQVAASSFLLLKVLISGWRVMKNFSAKQRLDFSVVGEYEFLLEINFQVMLCSILLSASFQSAIV